MTKLYGVKFKNQPYKHKIYWFNNNYNVDIPDYSDDYLKNNLVLVKVKSHLLSNKPVNYTEFNQVKTVMGRLVKIKDKDKFTSLKGKGKMSITHIKDINK